MKRLIVGLVFAILVAIFALENNRPLTIKFLFWTFPRISEALVIIGSVLLGVVLGAVLAWREHRRQSKKPSGPAVETGSGSPRPSPTEPQ